MSCQMPAQLIVAATRSSNQLKGVGDKLTECHSSSRIPNYDLPLPRIRQANIFAQTFAYSKPVIATGSSNKVVFPPLLSLFLSAIIPNSFSFACSDVRILEVAGSRAPGPCFYETSLLTTRLPPPEQQN